MAMKNVKLGLFFLWKNEADNLLEAEQSGEEDGTAIDGEGDGKSNHPIDIQLLDEEGDRNDTGHEKEDVKPITATHLELKDALGEEVLQKRRDGLHTKAGAGRSDSLESWYDDEIQQDIDDHACRCHQVELLEAAIGGEQGTEDVSR